jgi:outer membrane protein TolC
VNSTPRVLVSDLQDMHNDFRQKLDNGLDTMSKGGNGLPTPPAAAKTASPDGTVQPDLTADSDLQSQQADADSAEKEVQQAQNEPNP